MKYNKLPLLAVLTLLAACGDPVSPDVPDINSGDDNGTEAPKTIDRSTDALINVRSDVPLKAFFKDVFMDGGVHLSSKTSLPVTDYLGLSLEYFISSSDNNDADLAAQREVFSSAPYDFNGRLLYPDGAPRYRLVYVNGGNAHTHGESLEEAGRRNFKTFVQNGGCYIGSCAGAYLAAQGSDTKLYSEYLGLWPSRATNCHLSDTYTGHYIDEDSPLLGYYDFGGDNYVDHVYHNGGCYCAEEDMVEGTVSLARYDYDADPDKHNNMHGKTSIWAYKDPHSPHYGCVIMCGSHPESITEGERRDLMAAMVKYVSDRRGTTSIKAILHNGETITMDQPTSAGKPENAKIGDLQCHHFAIWIPEGVSDIKITLKPKESYNFKLMLAKDTFAYPEDALYSYNGISGATATATFDSLTPGQWYITVQCTSTVNTAIGDHGLDYTSTGILNGASYSLSASWK